MFEFSAFILLTICQVISGYRKLLDIDFQYVKAHCEQQWRISRHLADHGQGALDAHLIDLCSQMKEINFLATGENINVLLAKLWFTKADFKFKEYTTCPFSIGYLSYVILLVRHLILSIVPHADQPLVLVKVKIQLMSWHTRQWTVCTITYWNNADHEKLVNYLSRPETKWTTENALRKWWNDAL